MAWNVVLPFHVYLLINGTTEHRVGYNELLEKTMTVVRSCTNFYPNSTILLAGRYEEFFQQSLLNDVSVALISESKANAFDTFTLSRYSFKAFKQFQSLQLLWKLNHFIIVASSQPLLRLLLQRIKDSTWANFSEFHVLIDRDTEKRGCANAYRYLWTAWEYDLMSAIFLCIDPVEGVMLYGYNPYSITAPTAWQEVGRYRGRKGHPWLLLRRKYQNGTELCKDLSFDKTSNVQGYEVRLNAISFMPHLRIDPTEEGLDKFKGYSSEIVKLVFEAMNASLNVFVHEGNAYDLGGFGDHGNLAGMVADIGTGKMDMGMNVRPLHAIREIEHTYPHGEDGLCVITQRAGEIAEFKKLLSFMSPSVLAGNTMVLLLALCVLTRYQGFVQANLNIIRMFTSVSMRRLPRLTSSRIFFSGVFILCLIINALMQSHWASLLTLPVSQSNIKTREDLKRHVHSVYGSKFHTLNIHDPVIRSRYHEVSYQECKQQALVSRHAACLDDCLHLLVRIGNDSLVRSRRIQQNLQVYVTRENWPLYRRVTKLIQYSVEAGLVAIWKKWSTLKLFVAWKVKEARKYRSYRTLRRKHVSFSFYLLGIGHLCALLVFVVEHLVARYRVPLVKPTKYAKMKRFINDRFNCFTRGRADLRSD